MTTFAALMEEALYGPQGYYSSGNARTGRAGDYFTAPETGAAFGRLLANIFVQWRERLNADPFTLIEVGAGEGRLTEEICRGGQLAAHPSKSHTSESIPWKSTPPEYIAIERSASRREKINSLKLPIQVHADFSDVRNIQGILFANELIDAFPVHRVRMNNGKIEEGHIVGAHRCAPANTKTPLKSEPIENDSCDRAGAQRCAPTIQWSVPSTPRLAAYFDRLKMTLPEGYETEVNLAMADWLREASAVFSRGLMVLIDYGRPAWDYYAPERSGGTLRGFKDHQVLGLPELLREGSQVDWTADADFTSLALDAKAAGLEPLAFMEMGTFLKLGIDGDTPPLSALRYLLHPEGLGAQFHVLILGKNINAAGWTFEHNRLRRLGLPV